MGETLHTISEKARTLTRTGAYMSEASQRLAQCCQLRAGFPLEPIEGKTPLEMKEIEAEVYQHRKAAVGEDMSKLLFAVGSVRWMDDAECDGVLVVSSRLTYEY